LPSHQKSNKIGARLPTRWTGIHANFLLLNIYPRPQYYLQDCHSQCTTRQEQQCRTVTEPLCTTINEQVKKILIQNET